MKKPLSTVEGFVRQREAVAQFSSYQGLKGLSVGSIFGLSQEHGLASVA
jgi:hypothetical protein